MFMNSCTALRDREEVHQPALSHMKREVKDLKSAYWYEANVRAEINVDAMTQRTATISKRRLVKSLSYLDHNEVSPVNQLTQQTKELQEVVNTLQEVQDFTRKVARCPFTSEVNSFSFRGFAVSQAATISLHGI